MKRTILAAVAALPLVAFAQGPGTGAAQRGKAAAPSPELMQKRMRVARSIGLAEVLDLDAAQALKLDEHLSKVDAKRIALRQQLRDSHLVLRRAATGEKVPAAEVDQAIQKGLDAVAQLQTVDRETVSIVTQGLSPEKKARAVLFLSRFHDRFPGGPGGPGMGMRGRGMGQGGGMGCCGGMGQGGGMGPGRGMGPGMGPMGMAGGGPGPGDPWGGPDDDE